MPDTANEDPCPFKEGDFGDVSLEFVQNFLAPYNEVVSYHPGFIPDIFSAVKDKIFAFAHKL
ncbi:MAG: hypothetical protein MZU91_05815 [Desulfosudis oleivorans]|nr:hypothetical protein [Desulfosudis oleivorans]